MHVNWLLFVGLFFASIALDAVYAAYTVSIVNSQAARAAFFSIMTYLLGAIGVVSYVKNKLYLIPLAAGAFIGTYAVIKYESNRKLAEAAKTKKATK